MRGIPAVWQFGRYRPTSFRARDARAGWSEWRVALKLALQIVGLAALLVGMLWIGQGTGAVRWPASSFMVDQRPWAVRGMLLALIGVSLLWRSRGR